MVLATSDAHVVLTTDGDSETLPHFIVAVGAGDNSYSALRDMNGTDLVEVTTHDILDPLSFKSFWLIYSEGVIQVGKLALEPFIKRYVGEYDLNTILFSSYYTESAQWIVFTQSGGK